MKKCVMSLVKKYGKQLCGLAILVAPVAARTCRTVFYEPKEPEGLSQFVEKM